MLPKTIPIHTVEHFLSVIYHRHAEAKTDCQKKSTLRDIAVIELLFATGMRISELCSLKAADVNLYDRSILIYGKGSKERKIQIGNDDVIYILEEYKAAFLPEIQSCSNFFVSLSGRVLSDQSVRRMINKYTSFADIDLHITPHMFRHPYVKHKTKSFLRNSRVFKADFCAPSHSLCTEVFHFPDNINLISGVNIHTFNQCVSQGGI